MLSKVFILEPKQVDSNDLFIEGWYRDQEFTEKWDFTDDKVTKDVTLYGNVIKGYRASFETNSSITIEPETITNGTINKPELIRTKDSYFFLSYC